VIDADKARGFAHSLRLAFRAITNPDVLMRHSIRKIDAKERVSKAFSEEEMRRDEEHDLHVKRLLEHMDSFTKEGES
jgi:hypothetical protein